MTKLRVQATGLFLLLNLLAVPVATALGLGDVTVRSALNQPLDASIEVISVRSSEINGISAKLASPEAFENARIERPAYLDDLIISVEAPSGAAPYVHIVTQRPFREPFVHLLLEVNSPQGRLRREYTLLLDPPSAVSRPAAQPIASAATRSASRKTPMAAPGPMASASQYGPARKSETLWGIASSLAGKAGVSTQQMMLGLLHANPQAFHGDNINSMKPGVTLTVPSAADLNKVARGDAIRQVGQHNAYWQKIGADPARLPLLPGQSAVEPSPAPKAAAPQQAPATQLQIVTPPGGSAASTKGSAARGAEIEDLKADLALANEAAESRHLENTALKDRLTRLEDNVEKMQRLISLKDDEIATMQQRVAGLKRDAEAAEQRYAQLQNSAATVVQQAAATTGIKSEPATKTPPMAEPEPAAAAPPVPAPKPRIRPVIIDSTPTEPPGFIDEVMADPMNMMLLVGVVVLLLLLLLLKMRAKGGKSGKDDGSDADLPIVAASTEMGDEQTAVDPETDTKVRKKKGVGFGFKALLARFSKKKPDKDADQAAAVGLNTPVAAVASAAAVGAVAAALSGDKPPERVFDPLVEANRLIGDGYLEDAATVLDKALLADPSNESLQLKLMETYSLDGDANRFETRAEAFYADRNGLDDESWSQVVGWGRKLCPQNPLFMDAAPDSSELLAFDNDLIELDDLDLSDGLEGLTAEDMDLGSDLGLNDVGGVEKEVMAEERLFEPSAALSAIDDIEDAPDDGPLLAADYQTELAKTRTDMDLIPGLEMEIGELDEDHEIDLSGIPSELDEIFIKPSPLRGGGIGGIQDPIDEAIGKHAKDEDEGLDFPDFDMGSLSELDTDEEAEDGEEEFEFDLSDVNPGGDDDLDFGLDQNNDLAESFSGLSSELDAMVDTGGDTGSDTESAAEEAEQESHFAASDEVDTKLDLARAYVDMGDPDGARTMLEEVVEEGSDAQRQEAQSLLSQIN